MVPFFPEFRKIDYFTSEDEVFECGLGAASTHVLSKNKTNGIIKMSACGDNDHGQLGNGTNLSSQSMKEVQCEVQFEKVAVGAWHCLGLSEGKVYGWGKTTQG